MGVCQACHRVLDEAALCCSWCGAFQAEADPATEIRPSPAPDPTTGERSSNSPFVEECVTPIAKKDIESRLDSKAGCLGAKLGFCGALVLGFIHMFVGEHRNLNDYLGAVLFTFVGAGMAGAAVGAVFWSATVLLLPVIRSSNQRPAAIEQALIKLDAEDETDDVAAAQEPTFKGDVEERIQSAPSGDVSKP